MSNKRLKNFQEKIEQHNIDSFLVLQPENRRYLTGFTGSAGAALITSHSAYFITDFRYTEQAEKEIADFEIIDYGDDFHKKILQLLQNEDVKNIGFEEDYISYKKYREFSSKLSGYELFPQSGIIEELRLIKDEKEIDNLKKAVELCDTAFEYILDYIKPGIREKDIALEMEYYLRKNGAEGMSFPTIVASGYRSSLPHGIASSKKIAYGDLVTMDFGAVYNGYCSDMTRTICVGTPDQKQKEVYDTVLKAQEIAEDKIAADLTCKEADNLARKYIQEKGYGEYFGHGLGHGVGLAVHEKPALSFKNENILREGMTVTVEPGIYIPGWGGVRIEDIIVISQSNARVLNRASKEFISV